MKRLFGWVAVTVLCVGIWGCQKQGEVLFGAVLPLSGPVDAYGKAVERGMDLAFEEAQRDTDLPDMILETADSAADPDKAATQLEELYSKGAVAVIGGVTSAEALQMVKIADARDRTLVSPTASSPDLTGISRNFYRVFPSDFDEGTQLARFASEKLKLGSMAILAAESPYGRGIQGVFQSEFVRRGGEMLEVIEYPGNTSDFSGLVGRAATLAPDGVFIAAYWGDIVEMMKGLRAAGYEGKIVTTAAFATPQAVAAAGDAAENVYFTQTVFDLTSEAEPIPSFVAAYRAKYGNDPDLYAAHGYDTMRILIEALRNTDGARPADFWKGMRAIRAYPGATGSLQFDEKGDVQKFPRVYIIVDGAPIEYEKHVADIRNAFQQRLRELERQRSQLRSN